jgi:hypothetical protein
MTVAQTKKAGTSPGLMRRARREVRHVSDATVRLSSPLRMVPDFLIVGAQRSGTTSMFKTLMQHPLVARPFLRKGVHYFDIRYGNGFDWYRGHFPLTVSARLRRAGKGRPLTGESSPYYMFHPLAGARIARDLPAVKLIVLLRDPVLRAYSGHSHELGRGYETEPFERALELEPQRLRGERERMLAEPGYESRDWQHHGYLTRGQYIDQLVELERLFGRDRLHVVDSHRFFTDPAPTFGGVLDFLGLPRDAGIRYERHNGRDRSPLSPELRHRLEAHFEPYDERLAQWWGQVPTWRH